MVINSLPPGAQGATIAGIQGIGVNTPIAAAVAEATVGLLGDWHIPKGRMFTNGAKSMMVAFGLFWIIGRNGTVTINVEGVIPKVHFRVAPIQTYFAIFFLFYYLLFDFNSSSFNLTLSFAVEGAPGMDIPSVV